MHTHICTLTCRHNIDRHERTHARTHKAHGPTRKRVVAQNKPTHKHTICTHHGDTHWTTHTHPQSQTHSLGKRHLRAKLKGIPAPSSTSPTVTGPLASILSHAEHVALSQKCPGRVVSVDCSFPWTRQWAGVVSGRDRREVEPGDDGTGTGVGGVGGAYALHPIRGRLRRVWLVEEERQEFLAAD